MGNDAVRLKQRLPADDLVAMCVHRPESSERGATAVEYAMALALLLLASLAAITNLTTTSGSYLSGTGDDIGQPPERIADLSPSLPDPPSWVAGP